MAETGMSSKDKLVLTAIIIGTFMAALDATIVAVALPTIAGEFATAGNTGDVSWILLGYTLALCCFILLWGKLGSKIGCKKLFITGVIIFTICSLVIGLGGTFNDSINLNTFIIIRVLQGIGAGMLMGMGLALVSLYLPNSKGMAVGLVTLAASAGTAFGPALGGVLCHFHWSYIFFINVPIGIICVLMSMAYMKGEEKLNPNQKLDIVGVILMVIMMFSFIYYLNTGSDIGWMSDTGTLLVLTTLVSAGLLVWWELRSKEPLISVRLMGLKDVVQSNLVAVMLFAAMAGTYLLMPYFLQLCQGYNTIEMGLILIANSLGMMAVGPVVGKISDRTGINNRMVSIGCLVAALGFFLMARMDADAALWYVLLALFVMGAGVGIALVSVTNLSMGYAKPEENGEISGIINTFRQAGSTAGVAILESVFAAGLIVPSIINLKDFSWMMSGFEKAFFIAMVFALIAFMLSMGIRDKKIRDQEADN